LKYVDSLEYNLEVSVDAHASDYYSGWFDVSFANELISDEKVVTTNIAAGGETIDITVERYRPYSADTAILTHGQITTNTTTTDEQDDSSIGAATCVIGMRVMYHVAVGGSWAATEKAVITLKLYAKRN